MELHVLAAEDSDALETYCSLANAAHAIDSPWMYDDRPATLASLIRQGWDGDHIPRALAVVDGVAVGGVSLEVGTHENLELAWSHLFIGVEQRRQGHGTALWAATREWARSMGRPLVGANAWEGGAGEAFATAMGLEPKAWVICRQQTLVEVEHDTLGRLREEALAAASTYELVRVVGSTPPELIDGVAQLAAAINDAPSDNLEWDDEVYDASRIAAIERCYSDAGFDHFRLIARHRETGALAGHTQVIIDRASGREGHQGDTAVAREHRGHRLGLLLKIAMLDWMAQDVPELATLLTWNAEANGHMVAINELLGYEVKGRQLEYQVR